MFSFDEAAVNEQFGRMLDALLPSVASRGADFPAPSWPVLLWLTSLTKLRPFHNKSAEGGMKVIVDDRLARNNDAISLIVRQMLDSIVTWVKLHHLEHGCPLAVGPLEFEYEWVMFADSETLRPGVEAIVTAQVGWSALG